MAIRFQCHPGFVGYITCGDPNLATTRDIVLAAIDAGADVLELGVPFSDPVADGPIIQRASERSLRNGTTLSDVLKLAREIRAQRADAGLIIFSYLNPILRFGLERFCAAASDAGVDGALVTDLPVEEAQGYLAHHAPPRSGHHFPGSPHLHRPASAPHCRSFHRLRVCCLTHRRDRHAPGRGCRRAPLVIRLRRFTRLPIAVGFGISTAEHVREVAEFADAAVVGSAIVQAVEEASPRGRAPQAVAELVKKLSAFSHRLSAGSVAGPR